MVFWAVLPYNLERSDVLEGHIVSIIRVEGSKSGEKPAAVWFCRGDIFPKYWAISMLQGVRTHKTELFIDTAVKPQIQYELHCIYHIVLCFICHVHRDIVHMLRHVSL